MSDSSPPNFFSCTNHLTGTLVCHWRSAAGILLSPAQFRAQIKSALELFRVELYFFAQRSPSGYTRHQQEPLPPPDRLHPEMPPCMPARVMFRCVVTACQRLAFAPAHMHVPYSTTWGWTECMMERVMRGRVRKVQVRLQRRVSAALACASSAFASARRAFDACCSKLWMISRCTPYRSSAVKSFQPRLQAAATARLRGHCNILTAAEIGNLHLVWYHVAANASCVAGR
jgi:hypothetical protein